MINAYHEYSQVTLNDSLLDLYFKKSAQGTISNIPSTVIDYHFNPNPWPKNVNIWSMLIQNIVVPERIFIVFQTEKNRSSSKGNSFYYENMGLTEINFSVMSVSQNRYNQKRTSAFSKDEKLVVKSSEAYESLTENEKFYADLITKDIILKSNILNSGKSNVGINQSITFVCNELSVYEGQLCLQYIYKRSNVEFHSTSRSHEKRKYRDNISHAGSNNRSILLFRILFVSWRIFSKFLLIKICSKFIDTSTGSG